MGSCKHASFKRQRSTIVDSKLSIGSFQRHVRTETDRNIEVMEVGSAKAYNDGKKMNPLLIRDQMGTPTTCIVTEFGQNQLVDACVC